MDVCKRIVVPVSFNKASVHAIGEALFLAQKNGAEVVLVHVNTESAKTERHFELPRSTIYRVVPKILAKSPHP